MLDINHAPHRRLRELLNERWEESDEAFAAEIPMTPGHFSKLVNGHAPLRTSRKLERIAQLLATTADYILTGIRAGGSPGPKGNEQPSPWADSFIAYAELERERLGLTGAGPTMLSTLFAGAYRAAIRYSWPMEEIAKLDAWRHELFRHYDFYECPRAPGSRAWKPEDVDVGWDDEASIRALEMTADIGQLQLRLDAADADLGDERKWVVELVSTLKREQEADPEGARARAEEARRQFAGIQEAQARYLALSAEGLDWPPTPTEPASDDGTVIEEEAGETDPPPGEKTQPKAE